MDSMKAFVRRISGILRHAGKALLCLVQLYVIYFAVADGYDRVQEYVGRYPDWFYSLLLFAILLVVYIVLWRYYDRIDDRSFDAFCAAEATPSLWRDAGWLVNMALGLAGATPFFMMLLTQLWAEVFPALPFAAAAGLGLLGGLIVTVGFTVWRIWRLHYVWSVQKTLRKSTDQPPPLWRRILSPVLFFVGVTFLAVLAGDIPAFIAPAAAALRTFKPILQIAVVLLLLLILALIGRRMWERARFLRALRKLRDRGEISYTIHGHPYLAILSHSINFALTVTDEPSPQGANKTAVTYQVAVAECNRRRESVLLCENHVYQFRISLYRFVWYRNHSFEFPDDQGRRILVVDPVPGKLRVRGGGGEVGGLLDNGSKVFDYEVYGRNAFLHLLERY